MTKYAYVVSQYALECLETYYDLENFYEEPHKGFFTKEAAELYVKNNMDKEFPEGRGSEAAVYAICPWVKKVALVE